MLDVITSAGKVVDSKSALLAKGVIEKICLLIWNQN